MRTITPRQTRHRYSKLVRCYSIIRTHWPQLIANKFATDYMIDYADGSREQVNEVYSENELFDELPGETM